MAYSTRNSACVASKEYDNCSGDLIALNKLKGWVDLATRQPVTDREDGAAASEKAIIKSKLKIPFWVSDDQVKNTICLCVLCVCTVHCALTRPDLAHKKIEKNISNKKC